MPDFERKTVLGMLMRDLKAEQDALNIKPT